MELLAEYVDRAIIYAEYDNGVGWTNEPYVAIVGDIEYTIIVGDVVVGE